MKLKETPVTVVRLLIGWIKNSFFILGMKKSKNIDHNLQIYDEHF